ncbi:MAG TPA: hypothetical protein PKA64_04620 [Myxococcota bacterium]|nr:hypothetical protein [Myxococcota bacterium]
MSTRTAIILSLTTLAACDELAVRGTATTPLTQEDTQPTVKMIGPPDLGPAPTQLDDLLEGPEIALPDPESLTRVGAPSLGLVTRPTTLTVPAQFATISDALAAIDLYAIRGAGEITIQVAAGTYNLTAPIRPRHPDGARIRIVGDPANPASRVLSFSNVTAGFDLGGGYALGAFTGFEIRGGANAVDGVRISGRSTLIEGTDLIVDSWDDQGIIVTEQSFARLDRARVEDNGTDGIAAFLGSTVIAEDAISYRNRTGFRAWMSQIYAQGAEATANDSDGIVAESGGVFYGAALAYSNGDDGFNAFAGGIFDVGESVAADNGGEGFYLFAGSVMRGYSISTVPTVPGVDGILPPAGNGYHGVQATVGSTAYVEASEISDNGTNAVNARNNSEIYVKGSSMFGNGGCVYSEQDSHINGDGVTCSTIGGTTTSDDMWAVTGSYLSRINASGQAMTTANTTTGDRSQIKQ